jgi:hypothetical protein
MSAADQQRRTTGSDFSTSLVLREIVLYRQGSRRIHENPASRHILTRDLALKSPAVEEPAVRWLRTLTYGVILLWVVLVALAQWARAGGPKYVAGSSYFNAGLAGQPVTWAGGVVRYYTDQGDLSPVLRGTDADAFVTDAFSRWTSVSTVALSATRVGQLSEDVSGTNVAANPDRSISLPADILPSATDKPVAIVYDADGQVTEALLGTGASGVCFSTTAFGGVDAFSVDGHLAHALAAINGTCVQTSADLADPKYALVRTLGQILGVGWSQLNLNVITASPSPTADDKAGFPLMHPMDPQVCGPISLCYPNADQLRMDDRAALGRLYPVTAQNLAQFPGRQVFSANTARIHGSVLFVDAFGNPGPSMQGVNVVARWVDPGTGKPSTQYTASSVSGFLFRGNSGNPITGFQDPLGQDYARFGSTDAVLEGFFDLAGLEIPSGSTAQYQISVESLDPTLSGDVGPYAPWQVQPSGVFAPVTVTVSRGGDVQRDILMTASAALRDPPPVGDWNAPRPVPASGDWMGALYAYGDTDYFWFTGRNNRTLAIDVTTLDEKEQTSQQSQPFPVTRFWPRRLP